MRPVMLVAASGTGIGVRVLPNKLGLGACEHVMGGKYRRKKTPIQKDRGQVVRNYMVLNALSSPS